MITDRYTNYEDENQNFSEQYQDPFDERFLFEENQLTENDFLNPTDKNNEDDFDFEQNTPESDLDDDLYDEVEDLDENDMDDDLVERYDENDRDPDTFSDDGYKID